MSPITRLQQEARKKGWLSAPFSQSEQPVPLVPSGHRRGDERTIRGGFCFGLSMVWISHRLRDSAIDFGRAADLRLACVTAANIQMAMDEDLDFNNADSVHDIDRFTHTLGIACFPGSEVTDIVPRWWERIHEASGGIGNASASPGRRLFYLAFSDQKGAESNWAHATAFEVDGPVFRFFDPNYGVFFANGSLAAEAFVRWFFTAAAYRDMKAQSLRIIRMRRTS